MGRVNQSPKQKVPVAPQNGDIDTAKFKKEEKKKKECATTRNFKALVLPCSDALKD